MAIIKPSRKFAGSDLKTSNANRYIKEDAKVISFSAKENKEGVHLYILPAYKQDESGAGMWYKAVQIRDNFGDKFKEKYAVSPHFPDPVAHFERNFKLHFPDEAKPVDEVVDGRTIKRYPLYGRIARRVLFNVVPTQKLTDGPHILDLPAFGGASQIMEWQETKDRYGREKPLINDPENACAVMVKLKEGAAGNPWQIVIDPTDRLALPPELADSDNLHNLDEILEYKTAQELIEKLQKLYTPDVFELCMAGYTGGDVVVSGGSPVAKPKPKVKEAAAVVKPTEKVATTVAPGLQFDETVSAEEDQVPFEFVEDETPPPTATARPKMTSGDISAFLRKK